MLTLLKRESTETPQVDYDSLPEIAHTIRLAYGLEGKVYRQFLLRAESSKALCFGGKFGPCTVSVNDSRALEPDMAMKIADELKGLGVWASRLNQRLREAGLLHE